MFRKKIRFQVILPLVLALSFVGCQKDEKTVVPPPTPPPIPKPVPEPTPEDGDPSPSAQPAKPDKTKAKKRILPPRKPPQPSKRRPTPTLPSSKGPPSIGGTEKKPPPPRIPEPKVVTPPTIVTAPSEPVLIPEEPEDPVDPVELEQEEKVGEQAPIEQLPAPTDIDLPDHIQTLFEYSRSICDEPGKNCPGYAGTLYTYVDTGLGSSFDRGICSQQIVMDSLHVLTNRHCLPPDLRFAGADCRGRIYLKFPETKDYPAEAIHCNKVVALSEKDIPKDKPGPDWALLELVTEAQRPHAEISTEGVEVGVEVTAFVNDFVSVERDVPDKGRMIFRDGRIKKMKCKNFNIKFKFLRIYSQKFR